MTSPDADLLDFWLSIDSRGDGAYNVQVRTPTGDGREVVRLDSIADEAEATAAELNAEWRGRKRSAEAPQQEERHDFEHRLRATGRRLFDGLMVGSVGQRYRSSYDKATDRGAGLRLRLKIQDPGLAALPWELLYDSGHEHFIARTSLTSVVRYVEVDSKAELLQAEFPLSVLGVVSGPSDQVALAKDVERQMIERALADLISDGRVHLHWAEDGTFSEFAQALRRHDPHVVHFIGHGAFDTSRDSGTVLFEAPDGTSNEIDADTLGAQLLGHRKTVRLMVLNSCEGARSAGKNLFSSTAGTLVRRGVPAVIAMQYAITDDAALLFAEELYRGLADSEPVDRAVSNARLQMYAADSGSPEWGTPVLFLQSDTGTLFDVRRPRPTPPTAGWVAPLGATGTPPSGGTPITVTPVVAGPVEGGAGQATARRWRRVLRAIGGVVGPTRAALLSSAAALTFIANGYFKARDEQAKATAGLDAIFATIRKDSTPGSRLIAFNDLRGRQLPAQLESYAMRKVIDLVRVEHRATAPCSSAPNPRANELSAAFDAFRNWQVQASRRRQFSERAMSALLNALAENPARPLSQIVLDNVDLRDTDLSHLSLDSASFKQSCLQRVKFDSSTMHGATFDKAYLDAATFIHVTGHRASFHNAFLRGTDFREAKLSRADFFGARAACVVFERATLDTARFEHTEAPWSTFDGATFTGVLRWEDLSDLSHAMFSSDANPEDPVVRSALQRGAAPLGVDRREWIDGRMRAMRAKGACDTRETPTSGGNPS